MSKLLFAVAFAIVCACTQALVIPKYDKTCLPANAAPVTNFKPEQAFDGKNWYAIAGPPPFFLDCVIINAKFDASSKNITLTQTIISNGNATIQTLPFAQDPESNAVYNYGVHGATTWTTYQLAVVDTDYTSYTVMAGCVRPGGKYDAPYVLARTAQKPSNYDAIVAKLTTAGFQTDSAHFNLYPARCPN